MKDFPRLDLKNLKSYSIKDRSSKVNRGDFSKPWMKGGSFGDFLAGLPGILAAGDFLRIVDLWARAVRDERTIILAMGGHPVKVGLSPIIIDLMKRGAISLVAVNGSVMVHDSEVAMVGATSEDVGASLGEGRFGMGREANELINASAKAAAEKEMGLGRALGLALVAGGFPYIDDSLFASAAMLDVPVTVHVAHGTDVYYIHPTIDGGALGRAGMSDFKLYAGAVATLDHGLYINLGSAVVLPEVFLKALTLTRNLGYPVGDLTTVNMDFIRQYRPMVNVVNRPTAEGGQGFHLTGHHELMFPLLAAALIERLDSHEDTN